MYWKIIFKKKSKVGAILIKFGANSHITGSQLYSTFSSMKLTIRISTEYEVVKLKIDLGIDIPGFTSLVSTASLCVRRVFVIARLSLSP